MGQDQRANQRACRQRRPQPAQPLRTDLQYILGVNGQQHVRPAEQDRKEIQADHPEDDPLVEYKMEPAQQRLQRNGSFDRRLVMRPHEGNHRQTDQGRRGIEKIDPQRASAQSDQNPAHGRTGDG